MRLKIGDDKYALRYPQERPLENKHVDTWDENGVYLGIGCAFYTKKCGICILINGVKFDSNHIVNWYPK